MILYKDCKRILITTSSLRRSLCNERECLEQAACSAGSIRYLAMLFASENLAFEGVKGFPTLRAVVSGTYSEAQHPRPT